MLEDLDFVLNVMKENMVSMGIEAPNFPGDIHTDILHLTEAARMAVERAVLASRACLRDIQAVKDHLAKIMFCEKKADGHADKLKRAFFASVVWSGGLPEPGCRHTSFRRSSVTSFRAFCRTSSARWCR